MSPLKYIIFVERKKRETILLILKVYTRIYNYPNDMILHNNNQSLILVELGESDWFKCQTDGVIKGSVSLMYLVVGYLSCFYCGLFLFISWCLLCLICWDDVMCLVKKEHNSHTKWKHTDFLFKKILFQHPLTYTTST